MKWYYIVLLVASLAIAFFFGYYVNEMILTGKVINEGESLDSLKKKYSWTTAICNEKKECIDVHVNCDGEKVVRIEPVSELIKFQDDWKDIRGNNASLLCP